MIVLKFPGKGQLVVLVRNLINPSFQNVNLIMVSHLMRTYEGGGKKEEVK